MAAARMIAPKMASMMGSATVKAARPALRANIKSKVSTRAFSGMFALSYICPSAALSYSGVRFFDCMDVGV